MGLCERVHRYILANLQEGQGIDFKSALYDETDRDHAELLKDVSAFANGNGGRILCGVEVDADGIIVGAPGLDIADLDAEANRLLNIFRDCLDPPLRTVEIDHDRDNKGRAFVEFIVSDSPASPHRVMKKGTKHHREFFIRHDRNSSPATISDIFRLFQEKERAVKTIRDFVKHRREELMQGRHLSVPQAGPTLLAHIVPASHFGTRDFVRHLLIPDNHFSFLTSPGNTRRTRPNIYGVISEEDGPGITYVQSFNNNAVEISLAGFSRAVGEDDDADTDRAYSGIYFIHISMRE